MKYTLKVIIGKEVIGNSTDLSLDEVYETIKCTSCNDKLCLICLDNTSFMADLRDREEAMMVTYDTAGETVTLAYGEL